MGLVYRAYHAQLERSGAVKVLQVLAAGKTTREAAAALFLSPKTIEYHLRSVYGKLGINSRMDLAAAVVSEQSIVAHKRHLS